MSPAQAIIDLIASPVVFIDFEASALHKLSYPIEIGLCSYSPGTNSGTSWSTLIKPADRWLKHGLWSDESAAIHGISRAELSEGASPADALHAASRFAKIGQLAHCDGGGWDAFWLNRLEDEAAAPAAFSLGSWHRLIASCGRIVEARASAHLAGNHTIHRARPDAEAFARALAHGLGLPIPNISITNQLG